MSATWKTVRVPVDLVVRLEVLARGMEEAHSTGRIILPAAFVDRVPLYHVIYRAVSALEGHRERARKPRSGVRRPRRPKPPTQPGGSSGEGRVYMTPPGSTIDSGGMIQPSGT